MEDKVQLIKQEIERRIRLLDKVCNNKECETTIAYKDILNFIDSLPEEPINFPHEINIIEKVFGMGNLEINKESASEDLEDYVKKTY